MTLQKLYWKKDKFLAQDTNGQHFSILQDPTTQKITVTVVDTPECYCGWVNVLNNANFPESLLFLSIEEITNLIVNYSSH